MKLFALAAFLISSTASAAILQTTLLVKQGSTVVEVTGSGQIIGYEFTGPHTLRLISSYVYNSSTPATKTVVCEIQSLGTLAPVYVEMLTLALNPATTSGKFLIECNQTIENQNIDIPSDLSVFTVVSNASSSSQLKVSYNPNFSAKNSGTTTIESRLK